jgi:hypothetical protein
MKTHQFLSIFLLTCLVACNPASPAFISAGTVGTTAATREPAKATATATPTATLEPSSTPLPEWTPAPDFINQFTGTAYSLEKDQVQFTSATGEKTTIAQIRNGEIIFQCH